MHGVDVIAWLPLVLLAILSVTSGYIFRDLFIGAGSTALDSTAAVFSTIPNDLDLVEWTPLWVKVLITLVGLVGAIVYSYIGYGYEISPFYTPYWRTIYQFFFYRWYWDSVYNHFIAWPLFHFSYRTMFLVFDKGLNAFATVEVGRLSSVFLGRAIGRFQSGNLLTYLFTTVVLALVVLLVIVATALARFVALF